MEACHRETVRCTDVTQVTWILRLPWLRVAAGCKDTDLSEQPWRLVTVKESVILTYITAVGPMMRIYL